MTDDTTQTDAELIVSAFSELAQRVNQPTIVTIEVDVRLDPVPGWGDNAEDFRSHVEYQMQQSIPHYLRSVTVKGVQA